MGNFRTFSLADSVGAGQKLAANQFAMEGAVAERKTQGKAAVLRQKMVEGDPDAFAQLAGIDIDQATKTMNAVKTMDDNEREQFKMQNDAIAKAGLWVMQGQTSEDQEARFNQSVDHLEKQGMDMSQYKGQFSPQLVQNSIMQSRTIDQMITSVTQKGVNKGIDPKTGKPVFFSTNVETGEPKVMKDVRPSGFQVHGKGGKGGKDGRDMKASDSNAISKRSAEYFNVPFTKMPDGTITYKFPTSNAAKKASEIKGIAERIYRTGNIGHNEAFLQAIKEHEKDSPLKTKDKEKKSIKDYLTDQLKDDG